MASSAAERLKRFDQIHFHFDNVKYGLCVNTDGSRRTLRHAIAHEKIALAFQPIITSPSLYIPNFHDFSTVPFWGDSLQLPNYLVLKIACLLGNADDLDALAATSTVFRAVARSDDARYSMIEPWLPSFNVRSKTLQFCPRSLSRTFQRINLAVIDCQCGWDAVLWQAAALGCIHGMWLAMEKGATNIDGYSGGRQNREVPALWCAAKFNHLNAVKLLCEEGGADIDKRGGIVTNSSPLWVAAREGNTDIVQYLISKGADITSRSHNGRGHSVLDIAIKAIRSGHGTGLAPMMEIIETIRDAHDRRNKNNSNGGYFS